MYKGSSQSSLDRLERRFEDVFDFQSIFEYILTDRGSEFGDPVALETNPNGIQRSSIYYCDPMRSGQKGGLEQVHTMLRMILPKGSSFAFLTHGCESIVTISIPRKEANEILLIKGH